MPRGVLDKTAGMSRPGTHFRKDEPDFLDALHELFRDGEPEHFRKNGPHHFRNEPPAAPDRRRLIVGGAALLTATALLAGDSVRHPARPKSAPKPVRHNNMQTLAIRAKYGEMPRAVAADILQKVEDITVPIAERPYDIDSGPLRVAAMLDAHPYLQVMAARHKQQFANNVVRPDEAPRRGDPSLDAWYRVVTQQEGGRQLATQRNRLALARDPRLAATIPDYGVYLEPRALAALFTRAVSVAYGLQVAFGQHSVARLKTATADMQYPVAGSELALALSLGDAELGIIKLLNAVVDPSAVGAPLVESFTLGELGARGVAKTNAALTDPAVRSRAGQLAPFNADLAESLTPG